MEAFIFPVAPMLLALLASVAFLYRFWPHLLIPSGELLYSKKPKAFRPVSGVAEEESCGVSKESDFPAGWWSSKEVFKLEKRAIFSKTWLCLSHRSRFTKAGDYQSYEVAGFPIFLILGKDGKVRAFHNVCRHRAYTVTRKEQGSSAVLGCRYHGWSYNTYGELTKAPHFDEIPGFDRSQNSLFAIHTVTNEAGLVFVNLEASPTVSTTDTSLLDAFARKNRLDHQSIWVSGQAIKADFNWKMALRSKQLANFVRLEDAIGKKNSIPLVASIRGYFQVKPERFSFPPFTSFHLIRGTGWWCTLSFLPISEQKTAVRYDLYRSKNESSRSQGAAVKLVDVLREKIRELEAEYAEYQEISAPGPSSLHSNGLDTQKNILNRLEDHVKLEKAQGTEIFPAMRKPRENPKFQQAEQLCKELDCKSELKQKDLAW